MQKFKPSSIPNILTIIRMLLLLPILVFIFVDLGIAYSFEVDGFWSVISVNYIIAGVLFLISAITDALDGYLARKYKWISEFGKIWDPIADKVIINSVLISLAIRNDVIFYIPIILILRDTIVDAYRLQAIKNNKDVAANIFGKIKTVTLFVGTLLIFFIFSSPTRAIVPNHWVFYILQTGILHLGALFAILSGIVYVINFNNTKKINSLKS